MWRQEWDNLFSKDKSFGRVKWTLEKEVLGSFIACLAKTDITRCVNKVMSKFMRSKWTQSKSELKDIFDSFRVVDPKDAFEGRTVKGTKMRLKRG